MTPTHIKKTLEKWIKNHPDVREGEHLWFVKNAIGDLLGWPKWYKEYLSEIRSDKSDKRIHRATYH